jgi:hypothetical protein
MSFAVKISSLLLLSALYFLFSSSAHAQGVGFGVTKALFDISVLPGEQYEDEIGIINRSRTEPLPITIALDIWDLEEESEDIEFVTAEPALNAARWFSFFASELILAPAESRDIPFSLTVPATAAPGTYLVAMRLIPALPSTFFTEGGSRLIPEVVPLFFIRVEDLALDRGERYGARLVELALTSTGNKSATIRQFLAPRVRAGAFGDAIKKVVASITNNGRYHFVAEGYLSVTNWYGREVARVPLPARYLIPGKKRNIEIDVLPTTNEADSVFARLYRYIANQAYIGPYTVTMVLQYPAELLTGPDVEVIGATTERAVLVEQAATVWVFPWKFWSSFIVLVGGGFLVARRFGMRIGAALRVVFGRTEVS